MPSHQEFTVDELLQLSRAASGEAGMLESVRNAQELSDARFDGVARGFSMRPGLSMVYTELQTREDYTLTGEIGRSLNTIVTSGAGESEVTFSRRCAGEDVRR